MRWVVRCKTAVCHDANLLGPPLLLCYPDPGGDAGALFPLVPPYRLVKEMQEGKRTARSPVGS
jgi:hypothetical protein